MDTMFQLYMEDTEEMLQKAEECLIRLEMEYSSVEINELFRIAHTIKGSSHMVGYEDIGNIMHKIEDMLDCARNGFILFDQDIVSLCFKGLDIVKQMLEYKKEGSGEVPKDLMDEALMINEDVGAL
ncbi:MAG: signal transduction histidine kinase, partial [Defluviitaleaceae bacterium]|nr:signal transduction histidine kinase [Defluviitaleaceae bacterium]